MPNSLHISPATIQVIGGALIVRDTALVLWKNGYHYVFLSEYCRTLNLSLEVVSVRPAIEYVPPGSSCRSDRESDAPALADLPK